MMVGSADTRRGGPSPAARRGMTLIEMLVATLIMLVMMSFLIPIYLGTMRVKRRTEEVSALNMNARAAFDILRRDLTGAFRLAVETYDFGSAYCSGSEFHWEAPLNPAFPSQGFRRLTFMSAVDGSRTFGDPFERYEYSLVSWAPRGTLFRKVSALQISMNVDSGTSWTPGPPEGVVKDGFIYSDGSATFTTDVGVYRGAPYIMTGPSLDPTDSVQFYGRLLRGRFTFATGDTAVTGAGTNFNTDIPAGGFIMGGKNGVWTAVGSVTSDTSLTLATGYAGADITGGIGILKVPMPVTATLCYDGSEPPSWASDFVALNRTIATTAGNFQLFFKEIPDGRVSLGPNEGVGSMYFVLVGPAWWSLGETAGDLVFRAPAGYIIGPDQDRDTDGAWEDGEGSETADGIWSGGVPPYVDVELTLSDPDHPLGRRVFGQRIAIPAGEGL